MTGANAAADIAEGRGTQAEGLAMDADDWAAVRLEAFPESSKNEYRWGLTCHAAGQGGG